MIEVFLSAGIILISGKSQYQIQFVIQCFLVMRCGQCYTLNYVYENFFLNLNHLTFGFRFLNSSHITSSVTKKTKK